MSLLSEYIEKLKQSNSPIIYLEGELVKLIDQYNKKTGRFLFVYSAAISKQVPQVTLNMDDYYVIYDLLKNINIDKLDFYIETPGGSGEAAEEIVRFLHSKFKEVSFIVSGEAKSAGTIMALSGDEIKMTKSGSLGPIDAQMRVGRSFMSAYDYMEWVNEKRAEAQKTEKLNPFDATMIAQISPGELNGVNNALNFAGDLVIEWLATYKFKNWHITKSNKKTVSADMKRKRAEEIVDQLVNHTKWRSHGRSIKIEDLEKIGLKIEEIDRDPGLSDIVYRVQTVLKLIFGNSNSFKIYATKDEKIIAKAAQIVLQPSTPSNANVAEIEVSCTNCGKKHKIYAKLENDPQIDAQMTAKGSIRLPKDNKVKCDCGTEMDLLPLRNSFESQSGRKIID